MADLSRDRIILEFVVDSNGASQAVRGFSRMSQEELSKFTGVAGAAGQKAGTAFGAGMSQSAISQLKAIGAAAAGLGIGRFIKSSFDTAIEDAKSSAQLEQVLKSTGGAAGVAADHVERLAKSQQKLGIEQDIETRQLGALLLTFRAVKNEAGGGSQIFDRTLKISQDLAAALSGGTSVYNVQKALISVGKAMEDPITGLVNLRRVGVSFDTTTRQLIRSLVDQGDILGAQKEILKELEAQFGGTAAALAKEDPFHVLGIRFREFKEQIGRDLLPLAGAIGVFANSLFTAFEALPAPIRQTLEALTLISAIAIPAGAIIPKILSAVGPGLGVGGGGLLAATVGLGAFTASYAALNAVIGAKDTPFEELKNDAERLASSIKHVSEDNIFEKGFGLNKGIQQHVRDIKNLNEGIIGVLDTQGLKAGSQEFQNITQRLIELGLTGPQVAAALSDAGNATYNAAVAASNAKNDVLDLQSAFEDLAVPAAKVEASLDIADQFASITKAIQQVKDDRASLVDGTDAESDANDAVKDSYQRLEDSQDSLRRSIKSLTEARQELDLFNSPRGALERSLKLDVINRRVVTTPGESSQKQLDLLELEDANKKKQSSLTDAVSSGEKGVRDAYRGLDTAEESLVKAIRKRKEVHITSALEIAAHERDVQHEAIKAITLIKKAVEAGAISDEQLQAFGLKLTALKDTNLVNGPLGKSLDALNAKLLLLAKLQLAGQGKITGEPAGPQGVQGPDFTAIAAQDQAKRRAAGEPVNKLPQRKADGDFIKFATGGFENHTAQIAAAGSMRLWAEPETGGEAYIPLAGSKRARSVDILSKVADHFGMSLVELASGGSLPNLPPTSRRSSGQSQSNVQNVKQENHFHGSQAPATSDLDYANRELGWKLSRVGRG